MDFFAATIMGLYGFFAFFWFFFAILWGWLGSNYAKKLGRHTFFWFLVCFSITWMGVVWLCVLGVKEVSASSVKSTQTGTPWKEAVPFFKQVQTS